MTENVYQTTYKTAAIDVIVDSPDTSLVVGSVPPATIPGGRFGAQSGWASNGDFFVSFNIGVWYSYLIRVEENGTYRIGASVSAMSIGQLEGLVDGDAIARWTVPTTRGQATWQSLPEASVYLTKGLHAIRLRSASGTFNLNSLSIR